MTLLEIKFREFLETRGWKPAGEIITPRNATPMFQHRHIKGRRDLAEAVIETMEGHLVKPKTIL